MDIKVDKQGFVTVDGVKICKVSPDGKSLQFYDKDKRRSKERGCCTVDVSPAELTAVISKPHEKTVKQVDKPDKSS